jgi:hypothetical protein
VTVDVWCVVWVADDMSLLSLLLLSMEPTVQRALSRTNSRSDDDELSDVASAIRSMACLSYVVQIHTDLYSTLVYLLLWTRVCRHTRMRPLKASPQHSVT